VSSGAQGSRSKLVVGVELRSHCRRAPCLDGPRVSTSCAPACVSGYLRQNPGSFRASRAEVIDRESRCSRACDRFAGMPRVWRVSLALPQFRSPIVSVPARVSSDRQGHRAERAEVGAGAAPIGVSVAGGSRGRPRSSAAVRRASYGSGAGCWPGPGWRD